jgi:Ca2+-binding EF-hand superfamily protein
MLAIKRLTSTARAALLIASFATCSTGWAADTNNPLDPAFQTPQEKAYWEHHIAKLDPKGEGQVTRESFLKRYEDLWDKHVPASKTAVTCNELASKWAQLETKNPLDPNYMTNTWREEHIHGIDTDNDGSITKGEFLKHMEVEHWDVAMRDLPGATMRLSEVLDMMSANPLNPRHKFH